MFETTHPCLRSPLFSWVGGLTLIVQVGQVNHILYPLVQDLNTVPLAFLALSFFSSERWAHYADALAASLYPVLWQIIHVFQSDPAIQNRRDPVSAVRERIAWIA